MLDRAAHVMKQSSVSERGSRVKRRSAVDSSTRAIAEGVPVTKATVGASEALVEEEEFDDSGSATNCDGFS